MAPVEKLLKVTVTGGHREAGFAVYVKSACTPAFSWNASENNTKKGRTKKPNDFSFIFEIIPIWPKVNKKAVIVKISIMPAPKVSIILFFIENSIILF